MENTFNKIRKRNYELSPSTVADYYRKIGEIYFELKQNEKSLDWLKAGLILNPKLGVKKLIDKLEKK
jgi:tetratricopeptide (TPR) repeat protein